MIGRWGVHHAEVLDALATMPDASVDGCLTDVPYGLGSKQPDVAELIAYLSGAELDTGGDFMGNGWSVPSVRVWRELYRVLKPGAHVASFAGSRTGDEPVILARKPLDGTVVENVTKWGVGGLAIDACRIGGESTRRINAAEMGYHGGNLATEYQTGSDAGRWPANVCFDEEAGALLDEQSGDRPGMSGGGAHADGYGGGMFGGIDSTHTARGDSGGASRFFFCAKASRKERELGCEHLPLRTAGEATNREDDTPGLESPRAGASRTSGARNYGPCVKPIALDRWLASLILPPPRLDGTPRRLLNLYAGTGSEMIGALLAGWDVVEGVEREPRPNVPDAPDYLAILNARVAHAVAHPRAFEPKVRRARKARKSKPEPVVVHIDPRQLSLIGGGR